MQSTKNDKINSILLQVDEATKGIMEEIESGITDNIIEELRKNQRSIKELKGEVDEVYKLEKENKKLLRENNKLLKEILNKIENGEE